MRPLRHRVATTPLVLILGLVSVITTAATPPPTFGAAQRVFLGPDGQALPFRDDAEVLDFLRHASVVSSEPVGSGKSGSVRLLLEANSVRARGVP